MNDNLFRSARLRLAVEEPAVMAEAFHRWSRNSEYFRLLDNDPMHLWSLKKSKEWEEKGIEKEDPYGVFFAIRTLEDDRLIGFLAMFGQLWNQGDSLVAIGLGEPETWGKGYGSEAMGLLLQYAFTELNLHRVSLFVFEYNPRARRSYEKNGFQVEGHLRQALLRNGRRWDIILMGVLREDWQALQAATAAQEM